MIPGLKITHEAIFPEEETKLIDIICASEWNTSLRRRTQHHGYVYDYRTSTIDDEHFLGELPTWLQDLAGRLELKIKPDQVIVNEYFPGQGISPHIDRKDIFDNYIAGLSLGSGAAMIFQRGREKNEYYLEPRDLMEMEDEARYNWTHSIPPRRVDDEKERGTRYSITFRKVIKH